MAAFSIDRLTGRFRERFGVRPRVFSAPGRVNLIGEHTDYNEGFVLPFAIQRRTYIAAAPRDDKTIVAHSETLARDATFSLEGPRVHHDSFADYIDGVARSLIRDGLRVPGANLWIESEVEPGAGLSASAALELCVGLAFAVLGDNETPHPRVLALAGQRAEHEAVGTLCGIMDQFASGLGRAGHALLIDCRSLATELVRIPDNAALLVCDTRVKHSLATSAYNARRRECEQGVAALRTRVDGVRALRDVSLEALIANENALAPVVFRRCRHVVTENARTLAARSALARGDLEAIGALMNASHQSLRDDYEVSCEELDLAVSAAQSVHGVFGSRMTGGGFGGSTVTLCEPSRVEEVTGRVAEALERRFGVQPEQFIATAADGVRIEL